jgi:hypothetical protein
MTSELIGLVERLKSESTSLMSEGFSHDGVDDAIEIIQAMQKPVGWRYLDYAGQWCFTDNAALAADYADKGIAVEPMHCPLPPLR